VKRLPKDRWNDCISWAFQITTKSASVLRTASSFWAELPTNTDFERAETVFTWGPYHATLDDGRKPSSFFGPVFDHPFATRSSDICATAM
jgi:hypothetical protein